MKQDEEGYLFDGLNGTCEREDSIGQHPKFTHESFVQIMKEIEKKYGENIYFCIPEYLSYNKHLKKINDLNSLKFFKKKIKEKKIILTRNGKEEDDKSMISIAMNLNMVIISKDKKMENHINILSEEVKKGAREYIRENRRDYHFIDGKIAIDGFIPKKFKENN
jgi:hypothetical protein